MCAGKTLSFMVTDPSKFSAQGDGLGLVRVNQTASFTISAPCAKVEDIGVSITGLCFIHLRLSQQTCSCPVIYRHSRKCFVKMSV